jgi:hypothetical protein
MTAGMGKLTLNRPIARDVSVHESPRGNGMDAAANPRPMQPSHIGQTIRGLPEIIPLAAYPDDVMGIIRSFIFHQPTFF